MADESEDIEASTTSTTVTSSSQPQLLQVTPKDFYFPPPYTREVSNSIVLRNITSEPVTYKIKTTAPKRYVVRPPLGICPPGATVEVAVSLNYNKDPPAQPEKGDKFQVQAFALKNPPEAASQDILKEIWRGKPAVTKTKIAAHFSEPPAPVEPVVATPVAPAPVVAPIEHVVVPPVAAKPAPAPEPVSAIVSQSHPAKSRAPESKPFDNHVDPVSTPAPSTPSNMLVPLIVALLLGLLLGYILGVYTSSASAPAVVQEVAAAAATATATGSTQP